ncbi:hypothetical protein KXD96_09555 [Mycobacterium sp. SMC-2]|uniref:hypothetical protein n=1 Tax=Mycobacterium sp. SMC-2 TaxID=2857058 RepID=UPI0021B4600C|nr:hypothetical protein [Mycobacterium sp. SMC-2]UXA08307.1 hypothetical protein KXD96_09555 [Mycobacterium sp. SMC-2]
MDRLERTVVQLVEARRLTDFGDVAHARLALLLLDNAAETLLDRRADLALDEAKMYSNALRSLGPVGEDDPEELKAFRAELASKTVSEKTRHKIERNFSDLVKYVFSQPDCGMEPELAACINALHRFRNDAHHRDFVRADVLGPANEIYFYLCCRLLKAQKFVMMAMGDPPSVVAELLPDLPENSIWMNEKTLGDLVADELIARHDLDHGGIALALSAHLTARVALVEADLDEFMKFMGYAADRSLGLRVIQLVPLRASGPEWPEDFLTRQIAVTEGVIRAWAQRAGEIAEVSSAQDALRKFDEVESAIARFEDQLQPFMRAIDREIQHEIDLIRGK